MSVHGLRFENIIYTLVLPAGFKKRTINIVFLFQCFSTNVLKIIIAHVDSSIIYTNGSRSIQSLFQQKRFVAVKSTVSSGKSEEDGDEYWKTESLCYSLSKMAQLLSFYILRNHQKITTLTFNSVS